MSVIYNKTIWENNLPPSIDEYNLGKMEEGIYQNSLRIADLITLTTQHTQQIADLNDDVAALGRRMTTAENDIRTIKGNINTINNTLTTKADKSNTYTKSEISSMLSNYATNSSVNNLQNQVTNVTNTANATANGTYTAAQCDARYMKRTGDTVTGDYGFNGTVHVSGEIKTTYEAITLDTDMSSGFGRPVKLNVCPGQPSGGRGDVWIKNG